MEIYDDTIRFLNEMGISKNDIENPSYWSLERKIEDILSEQKTGIPGGFENYLDKSIANLTHLKELIDEKNKRDKTTNT